MYNAIYQNRLASEGGVCGKFNLSNCYLQINDEGKVIEEITDRMRKVAHVPVQTWKGWSSDELFEGWFSTFGGFKTLISVTPLILGICLILPWLAPLVLWFVTTLIETLIERKMASQVVIVEI